MTDEQRIAADSYVAAVEALTEARESERIARREATHRQNLVTEAERNVQTTQDVFMRAFGIAQP